MKGVLLNKIITYALDRTLAQIESDPEDSSGLFDPSLDLAVVSIFQRIN